MLLAVVSLGACRSTPDERVGADSGPLVSPPASAQPARAMVTLDACSEWSAHGVAVIVDGFKAAAASCPVPRRDAIASQWEGNRAILRASAKEFCTRSVGASYATKDARCYLDAKTVPALLACKFAPMTDPGDSDLVAGLASIARDCPSAAPPKTAPSGTSL